MPTARELLDQADALMRRNRSAMADDIPVLTDSVTPADARLRGRAPVPRAPGKLSSPDAIPTLTERVAPGRPPQPGAVAAEGEPSDWLSVGAGEPSVVGDAPDSIAIVPAVPKPEPPESRVLVSAKEEVIEVVAPQEVEEAFDEELAGRAAPERVTPVTPAEPPSAASIAAEYAKSLPVDSESQPEPIVEDVDDEALAPSLLLGDAPDIAVDQPQAPVPQTAPQSTPEPLEDALLGAPFEAIAERAAIDASDKARWDAVAEEIRVQVLQRIDLFTDTGLREQLGIRLQPIVDRASADLVATINQHVGELLRAYVSEAIEREIENWRRDK
jgi:hypothetical protein